VRGFALSGTPRAWLTHGSQIAVQNARSYFGPVSARVSSDLNRGRIIAHAECPSERRPACLSLRLPHPDGRRAAWVDGGTYDPATETVTVAPFRGQCGVTLGFA
jgi:hypothetical protein